jgi:hypothetical protein
MVRSIASVLEIPGYLAISASISESSKSIVILIRQIKRQIDVNSQHCGSASGPILPNLFRQRPLDPAFEAVFQSPGRRESGLSNRRS